MIIMLGFQPFLVIFCLIISFCSVQCFALLLRSLFPFFGGGVIFALSFFPYEFHFTLFNYYAHLGMFVHITNHARITTTAVLSLC